MRVLSLFDGISCGQVALERAGIPVSEYFSSEIEKTAMTITQKNFPQTKQIGDVEKVTFFGLPEIDLLFAGFPCQGFSTAGKQLNFDDPRSKLFFDVVRIMEEVKPKYFLLENVGMKKEWQDIISKLVGVEPMEINSSLVSAGLRKRLYWTNIPNITQPKDRKIKFEHILDEAYSEREKSYCIDANYGKGSNLRRYLYRGSRQIVFTDNQFMNEVTNTKPDIEECNAIGKKYRDKWRFLTPEECEKIQTLPVGYTSGIPKFWRYHGIGNGWTVDVISHILSHIPICKN